MADLAQGWHLGSHLERVRASHSYGFVMALIVGGFVFSALAPESDWTASVLVLVQVGTLVIALWTSGVARADSKTSVALVAIATAAALALLVVGGHVLAAGVGVLSGVLTVATITAIIVGVADQDEINVQSVGGAICIYVLLGMLFLFIYGVIATIGSGHLFAQGTDGTRSIRLYFSFVTLATLGYGDYTPAGEVARLFAVVEALLGQVYLVTVVAVLVARMGMRRRR